MVTKSVNVCSIADCKDLYYGSSFCKKHHQWHWIRGLLPPKKTLQEKFNSRFVKGKENECWMWHGSKNNRGYGKFSFADESYAHRHAYVFAKGSIPKDMEICHRCDNPGCVNPNHLFLGTHHDNMMDSYRKGRMRAPPTRSGADHWTQRLRRR